MVRLTKDGMVQSQITSRSRGARRLVEKGLIERRRRQLAGNRAGGLFAEIKLTVLGRAVAAEFARRSLTTWRGYVGFIEAHSDLRGRA